VFRNRLYYRLKPFLPWSVRMGVRRWFAVRKRPRVADRWPILPGSEQPPPGWPGWPNGKQFAFVLTHDVEGPEGLAKVRPLAELEMSLGFRSCFNFIPEGSYRVPDDLRTWLTDNGFEVGIHDLHHDGKLFRSRVEFARSAQSINGYLKDWEAVGFRAGFMLRQMDWYHDLDIQYDASTFDTDPFEPQPDGVGTIFPFWVSAPSPAPRRPPTPAPRPLPPDSRPPSSVLRPPSSDPRPPTPDSRLLPPGYVELPYTLPQDYTLFLLFREPTADLWLRKLNWIARHGGMALVNVHPDYVQFEQEPESPRSFPIRLYSDLLCYVRDRFDNQPWHGLPRQVAEFIVLMAPSSRKRPAVSSSACL
jgi:hypothetical protein